MALWVPKKDKPVMQLNPPKKQSGSGGREANRSNAPSPDARVRFDLSHGSGEGASQRPLTKPKSPPPPNEDSSDISVDNEIQVAIQKLAWEEHENRRLRERLAASSGGGTTERPLTKPNSPPPLYQEYEESSDESVDSETQMIQQKLAWAELENRQLKERLAASSANVNMIKSHLTRSTTPSTTPPNKEQKKGSEEDLEFNEGHLRAALAASLADADKNQGKSKGSDPPSVGPAKKDRARKSMAELEEEQLQAALAASSLDYDMMQGIEKGPETPPRSPAKKENVRSSRERMAMNRFINPPPLSPSKRKQDGEWPSRINWRLN